MNVLRAQQSRGLKARGFNALLPSIVPVFAGSMERVQQLAMSLEARGFGSSGKKTSLRETRAGFVDYVLSGAGVAGLVGSIVLVLSIDNLDTSQLLVIPPAISIILFSGTLLIFCGWEGR